MSEKIQVRLSKEMLDYLKQNNDNISFFIREAIREKIESGTTVNDDFSFLEIRCQTPFTYFAKLERVIDGDTMLIDFDLGFFTTVKSVVRLAGIDCEPLESEAGKKAYDFVVKELTDANLIIETRKKELYSRYLCYIYYSKEYSDFTDIIRYGKLLNEELIKADLAVKY